MNSFRRTILTKTIIVGIALTTAAAAQAQDERLKRPKIFDEVVECRSIQDDAARLACYDDKVAVLDTAQKEDKLIVADKEDVQEAKRGLFGLRLPKIKIFTGSEDDEVNEIASTIKSVKKFGYDKWIFTLEDGARWRQKEERKFARPPRPGQSIVVKKAAFGSFRAKINGKITIRVERIN